MTCIQKKITIQLSMPFTSQALVQASPLPTLYPEGEERLKAPSLERNHICRIVAGGGQGDRGSSTMVEASCRLEPSASQAASMSSAWRPRPSLALSSLLTSKARRSIIPTVTTHIPDTASPTPRISCLPHPRFAAEGRIHPHTHLRLPFPSALVFERRLAGDMSDSEDLREINADDIPGGAESQADKRRRIQRACVSPGLRRRRGSRSCEACGQGLFCLLAFRHAATAAAVP